MGPRENCFVSFGSRLPCEGLSFQRAGCRGVNSSNPYPDLGGRVGQSVEDLRGAGLSGRKVEYLQGIATALLERRLDPSRWPRMHDGELVEELVALRGLGEWSVHMYLIFAMGRADVLPTGDLAVRKGFKWVHHVPLSLSLLLPIDKALSDGVGGLKELKKRYGVPRENRYVSLESRLLSKLRAALLSAHHATHNIDQGRDVWTTLHQIDRARGHWGTSCRRRLYGCAGSGKGPKNERELPGRETMEAMAQCWRPFRSVGAWYMWNLPESF